MKYECIFIIFALYLVAMSAGSTAKSTADAAAKVENIHQEVIRILKDAAAYLKDVVGKVYLGRLKQVEDDLSDIENLRNINETCAAAEDTEVAEAVDEMFKNMGFCGVRISNKSADIMIQISNPIKQLTFGSYDVLRLHEVCKSCRNSLMKTSCNRRLTIKSNLFLEDARKSTSAIKETIKSRVPDLKDESDQCSAWVTNVALIQLEKVRKSIETCAEVE